MSHILIALHCLIYPTGKASSAIVGGPCHIILKWVIPVTVFETSLAPAGAKPTTYSNTIQELSNKAQLYLILETTSQSCDIHFSSGQEEPSSCIIRQN